MGGGQKYWKWIKEPNCIKRKPPKVDPLLCASFWQLYKLILQLLLTMCWMSCSFAIWANLKFTLGSSSFSFRSSSSSCNVNFSSMFMMDMFPVGDLRDHLLIDIVQLHHRALIFNFPELVLQSLDFLKLYLSSNFLLEDFLNGNFFSSNFQLFGVWNFCAIVLLMRNT